ncbi:MAG: acylphosphatase [Nocardioidaceae bacterium]
MTTPQRVARKVVVHGFVQGVSFRWATQQEAERAGVDGWVSNAYDGTVHALFEGPADAVDRLVSFVHDGPRHASVDRVDVADVPPTGVAGFEVR